MILAAQVAELGAALGTVKDLARVNAAIESLNRDLMDSKATFSRDELAQTLRALTSLSAVILSMDRVCIDRVARALVLQNVGGAMNCVS